MPLTKLTYYTYYILYIVGYITNSESYSIIFIHSHRMALPILKIRMSVSSLFDFTYNKLYTPDNMCRYSVIDREANKVTSGIYSIGEIVSVAGAQNASTKNKGEINPISPLYYTSKCVRILRYKRRNAAL